MTALGDFAPGDILSADDLNSIGVWESYTPVLDQNGVRTATVNYAKYVLINKLCYVNVDLTCTTTGQAGGNSPTITLPFANVADTTNLPTGVGIFFDSSASTTALFAVSPFQSKVGLPIQNTTLGNNDVVSFSLAYEVT
jgi:hypothetical protein